MESQQLCDLYRQVIARERELCLALERIDAYRSKIEQHKLQQQFDVSVRPEVAGNARRRSLHSSRFVRKTAPTASAIPSYYTRLPKAQFEQHERIVHQLEAKLEVGNVAVSREVAVKSLLTPAAKPRSRAEPHEHALLRELKAGALKLRPTPVLSPTTTPDPNNHSMGALLLRTLNSRRHSLTGLDKDNLDEDEDNKENEW